MVVVQVFAPPAVQGVAEPHRFFSKYLIGAYFSLERAMGIEPTSLAWEARVLPLDYARTAINLLSLL